MKDVLFGRRAFTLIELLVVILIVAILIAVALPSFLGQASKAQDSVVQQRLATTRSEAKAIWTTSGDQAGYPPTAALVSDLNRAEPAYSYVADAGAASSASISVSVGPDPNVATFCQKSQSGTVFCLRADELGGLIDLSGNADAPASAVLAPASADAEGGMTDVLRSSGPTESSATCVLDAGTPSMGGDGTINPSCQSLGGQAGWEALNSSSSTSPSATVSAPTLSGAPSISGTPAVGVQLTGSPGTWSSSPTSYAYQWQECATAAGTSCSPISGASGTSANGQGITYTPQPNDEGQYIELTITASNSAGNSTPETSSPTAAITAGASAYDTAVSNDASGTPALWYSLNAQPHAASMIAPTIGTTSLTAAGGVSFDQPGPTGIDNAVSMNASNGTWLSASASPITSANNWTIAVWYKPASITYTTGAGYILGFGDTGWTGSNSSAASGASVIFMSDPSNPAGACIEGLEEDVTFITPSASSVACNLSTSTWYFVVLTRDSSTTALYVDGQPLGSTSSAPISPSQQVYLGGVGGDLSELDGTVAEPALYTRAMTASEVQSLYAAR